MEEKLHPIVHQVAQQSQKNLVFRAFGIWHSKTRSLPAIRFRASRTKANVWEIWRAAMPQALQAKKAREIHTTAALSRAFEKWSQAYKTKRHLKEIARARYLRLPTRTNGSVATPKANGSLVLKATRNAYQRRNTVAETETSDSDAGPSGPTSRSNGPNAKPGIVSLLSSRPRAEAVARSRLKLHRERDPSPTRSKSSVAATDEPPPSPRPRLRARRNASPARSKLSYRERESSPARSVAPTQSEPERSRLWQELKQVRMRSRPPTEKSRSPEPPP